MPNLSTRFTCLLLPLVLGVSPRFGFATPSGAHDELPAPPLQQTYVSPAQNFSFVIAAVNSNWNKIRSTGTLLARGRSGETVRWQKVLRNRYRPRFAAVNNNGYTLTFDDWENTRSDNAIVIYDPGGRVVRRYGFDDVVKSTGVDRETVIAKARRGHGWWMGSVPELNDDQSGVLVKVADGVLDISIHDGSLRMK